MTKNAETQLSGMDRIEHAFRTSKYKKETHKQRLSETLTQTSMTMTPSQLEELKTVSEQTGLSASHIIRQSLGFALPSLRRQQGIPKEQHSVFKTTIR
ncbi:ribbon-helix-helix domain-containing protein [Kiritimatiellaeota bacterium B1221]|nr:ribbon-helix-helix domain-containing protein [Kiritimatiellaeota bacterium B1221]